MLKTQVDRGYVLSVRPPALSASAELEATKCRTSNKCTAGAFHGDDDLPQWQGSPADTTRTPDRFYEA